MKANFLLILLLFNFLQNASQATIENCLEENSETCTKCKDKYFQFFHNLFCLSCDDPTYGQIGCEGNCVLNKEGSLSFDEDRCKNGYYYKEGKCIENDDEKECDEGFYKNSDGNCIECQRTDIEGGYCLSCSENTAKYDICYCENGYTNTSDPINCMKCPNNCDVCEPNTEGKLECTKCFYNYALGSDKKCIYCGDACYNCELNLDNEPLCLNCNGGFYYEKNGCQKCPEGCARCKKDNNNLICIKCNNDYALNQGNNQCQKCYEDNIAGPGCTQCLYNKKNNYYECLKCYLDDYAYITNTYRCLDNRNPESKDLYGCLKANFDEAYNKYECSQCKDGFIFEKDDKRCIKLDEAKLSQNCFEAEKINKQGEEPAYSCTKCSNNYSLVILDSKEIKDCFERKDSLAYCFEGKQQNGNNICTKCVENAKLSNDNICLCNNGHFGYNNLFCYKCDDEKYGYPGCRYCFYNLTKEKLDCNECKKGYFKDLNDQCHSCSEEIGNCNACDLETNDDKLTLKCYNCNELFHLDSTKNTCELNECKEYPEISSGCIICNDQLNSYYPKKRCQTCKYGYFKLKNEKCAYCRSEEYGGPACYECGYEQDEKGEDTDKIICKDCYAFNEYHQIKEHNYFNQYFTSILSSEGKCYNCKYDLSDECLNCEFIRDKDNKEKLTCLACSPGYYLNSEGKCVVFPNQIETTPNCYSSYFYIGKYTYIFSPKDEEYPINAYYEDSNYNEFLNNFKDISRNLFFPLETTCEICDDGYAINEKGECEKFELDSCTGENLVNIKNCIDLCKRKNFPIIYALFDNNVIDKNEEHYNNIIHYSENIKLPYSFKGTNVDNEDLKNYLSKNYICLDILEEKIRNQFNFCEKVLYNPITKKFQCFECKEDYILDSKRNICIFDYENNPTHSYSLNCIYKNIGDYSNPIYSCIECIPNYTLVTYSNGINACIPNNIELKNCNHANVISTYYINNLYKCISYEKNYISYYSKFYQRYMCHNIYEEIIKNKDISLDIFKNEENKQIQNGNCEKNYFTPGDGKCYNCDNEKVGMPGCKGECDFSYERDNTILCKGECKEGYIESSKGICELCENVNEGCNKCHYEEKYPEDYKGIKRERRFECDNCKEGYIKSKNGECLACQDLVDENCDECQKDDSGKYKCTKCKKHYAINNDGICSICVSTKALINNKCINCDDKNNGGIENCILCKENDKGDGIICGQCNKKHILFSNENTCIERNNNKDLDKFNNCLVIKSEGSKLICSRCKPQYSLIKNNNEFECVYTPTLFDSNFEGYYFSDYRNQILHIDEDEEKKFSNFLKSDYAFRHAFFMPCKEAVNLGTSENPLYSCNKCYNFFNDEEYDYFPYYLQFPFYKDYDEIGHYDAYIIHYFDNYKDFIWSTFPVKINDKMRKNSYCIKNIKEIKNCLEATYEISKAKEIYNCTKCMNGYQLGYNQESNVYYCYKNDCQVINCKTCEEDKFYFCSICGDSDYEINKFTGSCVKKTEFKPTIIWKDVYQLIMEDEKEINGKKYEGASLKLRGITTSIIPHKDAFMIYLIFRKKHTLRNLQETKKIEAICEFDNDIEETLDKINIVNYKCIGNETVTNEYELNSIESIESNYINNEISINNPTKENSEYTSSNLPLLFNITNHDINDKNFINNKIDFSLNGELNKIKTASNKEITNQKNIQMELKETDDKVLCDFTRDKESLKANFICNLNIKNESNILPLSNLTFKNNEIKIGEVDLLLDSLDKINITYDNIDGDFHANSRKKSSSNKTTIIVICVVVGIVVACGVVIALIYIFKSKMKNKMKIDNNNNIKEVIGEKADYNASNTNIKEK